MKIGIMISALITALLLSLCNVKPVQAVYGGVQVIGPTGENIVKTKVTIFNKEGDKQLGEGEMDDKGLLYFEWPKRGGEYLVKWEGEGNEVIVKAPQFSKGEAYTGGAAAAAAVTAGIFIAAANTSGGDSKANGTKPKPPESMTPSCSDLNGIFQVSGDGITGSPEISCSGNVITIFSSVAMTGSYNPQTGKVEVSGSDAKTTESFSGTAVKKDGKITISGKLTYTDKKSGKSNSHNVTYTKKS